MIDPMPAPAFSRPKFYLLFAGGALVLLALLLFQNDAHDYLPALRGASATAAVDYANMDKRVGRHDKSRCVVTLNFQVEPGFSPRTTVVVAPKLCESLKPTDKLEVRYLRPTKGTVWAVALDDGGFRRDGLVSSGVALAAIALGVLYLAFKLLTDRRG